MKRIINEKTYDTEKSKFICDISNELYTIDSGFIRAALYVTENADFFLAGEGGADTMFAKRVGFNYIQSSNIIVVTKEEAKKWMLRACCNIDDFEKLGVYDD